MTALPSTPVHRRHLAQLALVAVGLSGCSAPPPTVHQLPDDSAADPDRRLLGQAWRDEHRAALLLDATVAAFPGLAPRLGRIRDVHRTHADLLSAVVGSERDAPPTVTVPSRRSAALEQVQDSETRLLEAHSRRALRAASGRVARVLAGAAAAAAQHSHQLAQQAPGRQGRGQ